MMAISVPENLTIQQLSAQEDRRYRTRGIKDAAQLEAEGLEAHCNLRESVLED